MIPRLDRDHLELRKSYMLAVTIKVQGETVKSRESLIGLVMLMSGDTTTMIGSREEGFDILYAYTFGCKGSRKGGDALCSQGDK